MIVSGKVILLVAAVILFLIATFFGWFLSDGSRLNRFNLVAAGLFCFAARELLT